MNKPYVSSASPSSSSGIDYQSLRPDNSYTKMVPKSSSSSTSLVAPSFLGNIIDDIKNKKQSSSMSEKISTLTTTSKKRTLDSILSKKTIDDKNIPKEDNKEVEDTNNISSHITHTNPSSSVTLSSTSTTETRSTTTTIIPISTNNSHSMMEQKTLVYTILSGIHTPYNSSEYIQAIEASRIINIENLSLGIQSQIIEALIKLYTDTLEKQKLKYSLLSNSRSHNKEDYELLQHQLLHKEYIQNDSGSLVNFQQKFNSYEEHYNGNHTDISLSSPSDNNPSSSSLSQIDITSLKPPSNLLRSILNSSVSLLSLNKIERYQLIKELQFALPNILIIPPKDKKETNIISVSNTNDSQENSTKKPRKSRFTDIEPSDLIQSNNK